MSCPLTLGILPKRTERWLQACGLDDDTHMNCSLEVEMPAQNGGSPDGGASKSAHPTGGGTGRLAVKWWGRSAGRNPKKQSPTKCPKVGGAWRRKLLATWVLGGIVGSVWIFLSMNAAIGERRKEMLMGMCDERARMLQDQFAVSMNHVHALAILVSTFHHGKQPSAIDQKTFAEYTARTAFERPLTSGVAYAKKVLHSEREQFERQQGWTIRMMNSREPSPVQDEYAPVIFSQDTVSYIASLDMMSGKNQIAMQVIAGSVIMRCNALTLMQPRNPKFTRE